MSSDFLFEFKRQTVHIIAGLAMAFLAYFFKPVLGGYIIAPMLAIILFLWFAPRIGGLPLIGHLIRHFERKEDIEQFPFRGAFWYNIGITIPVMLLGEELAAAVIAILSLGDGSSTLIGRFYGKHRWGRKSLEGFLSFLVFGTLGAMVFLDFESAFILALLGGVIELSERFNDNLTIPVGLTIVSLIFGF